MAVRAPEGDKATTCNLLGPRPGPQ